MLRQDVQMGVRQLRRSPGFAIGAVLTLALGVGLSTAVFSIANTLLLEPLTVHEQNRIVVLWGRSSDGQYDNVPVVGDEFREYSRASRALSRLAFVEREGALEIPVELDGANIRLHRSLVSADFFDVLGTRALLGRALGADDDVVGAPPVAVLSYGGWQRQFGGDPHVIGRRIRLKRSGANVAIVGVMPQGLDYPRGTDYWTAVVPATTGPDSDHPFRELDVVGRLAPNASTTMARDELTTFFGRSGAPALQRGVHGVVHTLPELVIGDAKAPVLIFSAAAALLLFIACINVANLLFIRGVGRVREIAVRGALGASRARIVRYLLTESVVLALVGGIVGAAVAAASLKMFVALAPGDVPRLDELHVGIATLGYAMAIATLSTVLFGVGPALIATHRDASEALRSGARQTASRAARRATELLAVGQVALALMMLSAAGLVARTLFALEHVTYAYDPTHLVLAELSLRGNQFGGREKQIALLDRLLPRVAAIPGVVAVSPVNNAPFSGAGIDGFPTIEGQTPAEAAKNPITSLEAVEPSYFASLGISIIAGRGFTASDRAEAARVAIVNRSFANRFWPNQNAIGKRLMQDGPITIVGVVPDTRYRDLRMSRPTMYLPLLQSPFPFAPTTLAIRTRGSSSSVIASLRTVVAEVDATAGLGKVSSFDELLDGPLAHPRLNAALLTMFACAALVLAAIGLFGVMMAMVRQRTGELGIRVALGATGREIARMIAARGGRLISLGVLAGLAGAIIGGKMLQDILFEIGPTDAVALVGATALLSALAAVAILVPAMASSRTDPVIALRSEN